MRRILICFIAALAMPMGLAGAAGAVAAASAAAQGAVAGEDHMVDADRRHRRDFDHAFAVDQAARRDRGAQRADPVVAPALQGDTRLRAQQQVGHRAALAEGFGGDAGHGRRRKAGNGLWRKQRHRADPYHLFAAAVGGHHRGAGLKILDRDQPFGGFDQRAPGDGGKGFLEGRKGGGDAGRGFHRAIGAQPGGFIAAGHEGSSGRTGGRLGPTRQEGLREFGFLRGGNDRRGKGRRRRGRMQHRKTFRFKKDPEAERRGNSSTIQSRAEN